MKLRAPAAALAEAFRRSERLGRDGVSLTAAGDRLVVEAGDRDAAITTRITTEVIEPGSVVVASGPASRAASAARSFADEIELVAGGGLAGGAPVDLRAGAFTANVPVVAVDRVAIAPVPTTLTVPAGVGELRRVVPAAASAHPILGAVHFEGAAGRLTIVASDGRRVAAVTFDMPGLSAPIDVSVPAAPLASLLAGSPDGADLLLGFGPGVASAAVGDVTITARLMAGAYPAWRAILPGDVTTLVMDRGDLTAALDAIRAIVGTEDGARIILTVHPDRVDVRSQHAIREVGKGHVAIGCRWDGEPGRVVAYGPGQLAAAVAIIEGDSVALGLGPEGKPSLVSAPGSPHVISAAMPVYLGGVSV